MDTFFDSVFATSMNIGGAFASIGAALLLGVLSAWLCSFRLRSAKGLFIAGALMPAVIATVFILMGYFLEGSLSTTSRLLTLAVALGLIRFRSVNAKAEELLFLFLSVALGVAFGLCYIGITFLPIFTHKKFTQERLLKITIPESLDYSDVFDDTFRHYLSEVEMVGVKTTNMGSMFRLSYRVILKDVREEKELIDELRTKNGNLEISLLPYVEEQARL